MTIYNITYRKAAKEDLDTIVEIVKGSVPVMHSMNNKQWDHNYPSKVNFANDIDNNVLWVAVDTGSNKVVGMVALTFDQYPEYEQLGWDVSVKSVVPHRMAVDVTLRNTGVGAGLMSLAEDVARENNCKLIRVDTNENNMPMNKLFEKLGYVYSGKFAFTDRPPENYGMWKAYYKEIA